MNANTNAGVRMQANALMHVDNTEFYVPGNKLQSWYALVGSRQFSDIREGLFLVELGFVQA